MDERKLILLKNPLFSKTGDLEDHEKCPSAPQKSPISDPGAIST
jgi:hypothetical protein